MIKPRKAVEKTESYDYPAPFLKVLKLYKISKEQALKLDYNEPTIEPSRKIKNALKNYIQYGELQWYPGGDCKELRNELAKYTNVKPENIIVGNGSDELLKVIAFTYLSYGDEIIVPVPNYSMSIIDAKLAGANIIEIPCDKELRFDIRLIIKAITKKTKIVYISNPNSPIGNVFQKKEIINLLEKCRNCFVIVDEAYFEFCGESVCELIYKYSNLIVTRTFSKAFSLASLRLGYAISNKENINNLVKVKDPESVNTLAQIAGIQSLKDLDYMKNFVKGTLQSREYLSNELRKLRLKVYDSKANFILVRFPKNFNSIKICQFLETKGIFLRDRSKVPLLENCVRIGVPLLKESKKLISEISKIINPLLIFDIDGVLVDVSKSYRVAIKKTSEYFTKKEINFEEIQTFKNKGGLNNDWDLTEVIIKDKDFNVDKKSVIKKFQGYYNKLRNNERWILNKNLLKKLSKRYNLTILTGRPKNEAYYVLEKNKVANYFKVIISMEDVSKQKPNPEGLLKILNKFPNSEAYYFGDSIDDMKAAVSANIIPIGVLPPQDKSLLLQNLLNESGAKTVISNINQIMVILK